MQMLKTSILLGLLALSACSATQTTPTPTPDVRDDAAAATPEDDTIIITSPRAQSLVEPGFTVTGLARGSWYMEGTFPVELVGSDGTVLATGAASTNDDWMTEDFVPFEVSMTWEPTALSQANLILHKANPSGMPENDAEVAIPVSLAPQP